MKLNLKLAIPLVLVLLVAAAGAYKILVLSNPPQSPKEVVTAYMQDLNAGKTAEAENLLSSSLNSQKKQQFNQAGNGNAKLTYTVSDPTFTDSSHAAVTMQVNAVIVSLPLQFGLTKEGNLLSGYSWKIHDLSAGSLK